MLPQIEDKQLTPEDSRAGVTTPEVTATRVILSAQSTIPKVALSHVSLLSFTQDRNTVPITENVALNQFGVYGLSSAQERVLCGLPLSAILSTMQLFGEWVKDERYEFSDLPFIFKSHMSEQDLSSVQQLDKTWKGWDIHLTSAEFIIHKVCLSL